MTLAWTAREVRSVVPSLTRTSGRFVGVDEAGRGPLAGPVVAAAVVLPHRMHLPALDDSKKLTPEVRSVLCSEIKASAEYGIGIVPVDDIENLNILGATMLAMSIALKDLARADDLALIDGNRLPETTCPASAVVKGDGRIAAIAAASVLAKVTRDRIMTELSHTHPGYGWERNAGYGTREHLSALRALGPTVEHRKSFAPVRAALEERAFA